MWVEFRVTVIPEPSAAEVDRIRREAATRKSGMGKRTGNGLKPSNKKRKPRSYYQ